MAPSGEFVVAWRLSLPEGQRIWGRLFDADGSAFIVHEKPDTYGEGDHDTGSRIACGVIQPDQ